MPWDSDLFNLQAALIGVHSKRDDFVGEYPRPVSFTDEDVRVAMQVEQGNGMELLKYLPLSETLWELMERMEPISRIPIVHALSIGNVGCKRSKKQRWKSRSGVGGYAHSRTVMRTQKRQ